MLNKNLCEDTLINVNKITINECDREKYIKFAQWLDDALRRKYEKYYICDQVNESRDYPTIFFVEAFYRDVDGVYSKSEEANEFVEKAYDKVFGNNIKRESITSFRDVNKVYPLEKNECDKKCNMDLFDYEESDNSYKTE